MKYKKLQVGKLNEGMNKMLRNACKNKKNPKLKSQKINRNVITSHLAKLSKTQNSCRVNGFKSATKKLPWEKK